MENAHFPTAYNLSTANALSARTTTESQTEVASRQSLINAFPVQMASSSPKMANATKA
jgi:hypothetical protein